LEGKYIIKQVTKSVHNSVQKEVKSGNSKGGIRDMNKWTNQKLEGDKLKQILELHKHGKSIRQIYSETRISRTTIMKYINN